jgi:Fic family protein
VLAVSIELSHRWSPIAPPPEPDALIVPELRAFEALWRRERESLHERQLVDESNERMARWWAIETGIIERLYDVSEGITVQLIEKGFQASLIPHDESTLPPEELIAILKDHREGLELVMDVVTGRRSLTTGWIKELHALLTRHQTTTDAIDTLGRWIKVGLLRGEWKKAPNNPLTAEGRIHEYCPPEHVASEMDRLLEIHASLEQPEVRSAWLHHAFVQIHPFQDGNGRVARALASIDMIKTGLFPLLVRRDERDRYIAALRAADHGDLHPLVRYFADVQEALIRRAISEAQGAIDARGGLQSVLAAAENKLLRRGEEATRERAILRDRLSELLTAAQRVLEDTAKQVRAKVSSVDVRPVTRANPSTRSYFRSQLLAIGKQHGYWVDLNEYRDWVRLQLRDGGVTDIVVATHLIGNPSPGAGVAVVFVEHRDLDEPAGSHAPMTAAAEPLLLAADEDELAQRHRFLAWLEPARNNALAQWTRFL